MPETATLTPNTALWTPETPAHAFDVQMLSERPQPVPVDGTFASPFDIGDAITARYMRGDNVIVDPDIDPQSLPGETELRFDAFVAVSLPEFKKAVDRGMIPPELQNHTQITPHEAVTYNMPGTFPEQESKALLNGLDYAARRAFKPDWTHLPKDSVERQEFLTQIITFEASGKQVNLYNFTKTQLSAEHIGKIANALREMSDRTGGAIFDMLDVMAVMPNDDEIISPRNENGECTSNSYGVTYGGAVVLAEHLFDPDTPYPEVTAPDPDKLGDLVDDDNPYLVQGEQIQLTVFHELAHVVTFNGKEYDFQAADEFAATVGWEYHDKSHPDAGTPKRRGTKENPAVYGRTHHLEDIAVTSEAGFVGGETIAKYDDSRKLALQALWAQRHSDIEGPTFVRATEMPLPTPPDKVGLPPASQLVLAPRYTYTIFDPDLLKSLRPGYGVHSTNDLV